MFLLLFLFWVFLFVFRGVGQIIFIELFKIETKTMLKIPFVSCRKKSLNYLNAGCNINHSKAKIYRSVGNLDRVLFTIQITKAYFLN